MPKYQIPQEWCFTTLGEVVELKYGKSLPATKRDGGSFPVYGSNGVVGNHSEPLVKTEGIIIGRKGSYGEIQLSHSPFFPIDTTYYVDDFYDQPLKYWFYQLKLLPLTELNRSTAIPRLNREDAYSQVIHLPPLAEQKVIADKLDTLLAQVENTKARLERIPEILKTFRQSVLAAAVSGKLTVEWKSKSLILEDISYFQNGFAFKSGWFESEGEYQVIKLGNIRDGYLAVENSPAFLKQDVAADYLRFTPESGDTLISMTGTRFKQDYGFGCLVRNEKNLLVNQRVGRLIPNRAMVLPEYLNIYVRSELFRIQFFEGETGGVNQGNVGSKHIMNIGINLPTIEQQTEIVRKVEELFAFADSIEEKVNAALKRVNKLTQSILAKAFRGELTANWRAANPELICGKNSAEALLEKIKAEREAFKPVKKSSVRKKS